jgi:hypothetical protein
MTVNIITLIKTIKNATQHYIKCSFLLGVVSEYCYVDCHYAECRGAQISLFIHLKAANCQLTLFQHNQQYFFQINVAGDSDLCTAKALV